MKKLAFFLAAWSLLVSSALTGLSQQSTNSAPPSAVAAELQALVATVKDKIKEGKTSEEDLAAELKSFDALLARHKDEKTDDVAQVLLMKAMLYVQVIEKPAEGLKLVQELKASYPDTRQGKQADEIIANINKEIEKEKANARLARGAVFPDFKEKDLKGAPLSVSEYKGKVVLVDFWATWCGPCVREMPAVAEAYSKYHDQGFEIIGISLDKNENDLNAFLKKHDIKWRQYFDGKGWANKLALAYGVESIPAMYLLDREGKIAAVNPRGSKLTSEIERLLKLKP